MTEYHGTLIAVIVQHIINNLRQTKSHFLAQITRGFLNICRIIGMMYHYSFNKQRSYVFTQQGIEVSSKSSHTRCGKTRPAVQTILSSPLREERQMSILITAIVYEIWFHSILYTWTNS